MRDRARAVWLGGLALVATAITAAAFGGVALAKPAQETTGTAYVGVTHVEGDDIYVSGDFKDSKLGRGAIVYVTRLDESDEAGAVLVRARKVTIYTKRGSLSGTGEATQVFNEDGSSDVKDGSFKMTKGTGAYKGHTFKGTFGGPFEDGVYTFDYEAKYK